MQTFLTKVIGGRNASLKRKNKKKQTEGLIKLRMAILVELNLMLLCILTSTRQDLVRSVFIS